MTTPNITHVAEDVAALAADRAPSTIRYWVHRGWLTPHGPRLARTYDLAEVHRVAAALNAGQTPTQVKDKP